MVAVAPTSLAVCGAQCGGGDGHAEAGEQQDEDALEEGVVLEEVELEHRAGGGGGGGRGDGGGEGDVLGVEEGVGFPGEAVDEAFEFV